MEWLLVTTVAFLCAAAATITVVNIADVKDGTAWAQTIGSFGAIIVAFFVGKHQADAAIESVREGDRLQTSRRYSAILAVVDTAKEYTNNTAKIFAPNNFSYVTYKCCYSERDLKSIINALEAIPAHELRSYESVDALLKLRTSMFYIERHMAEVASIIETLRDTENSSIPPTLSYDSGTLQLACSNVARQADVLHDELAT